MNLVKFCNKYDGIVINGIQTMRFFLPLFVDSGKTEEDVGLRRGRRWTRRDIDRAGPGQHPQTGPEIDRAFGAVGNGGGEQSKKNQPRHAAYMALRAITPRRKVAKKRSREKTPGFKT